MDVRADRHGRTDEHRLYAWSKEDWRHEVLRRRKALTPELRRAEATAVGMHVVALGGPGVTVCAYVPVGSEPGSVDMLDALVAAGTRVLLPIAREPGTLAWAIHTGTLVAAPYGLREPAGPVLPAATIAEAGVVLVPALAVDRRGVRLGRGAGFYDRTLTLVADDAVLAAVVRDDEVVDRLPAESHDVPVRAALTPGAGLVALTP